MAETQIKITADTRDAEREINRLNQALSGIDKTANLAGKALAGLAAVAGAATAALGIAFNRLDDLGDAAEAIGVGVNELKALQKAAAAAGVDTSALEMGFRKLSGSLSEAFFNSSSQAAKSLKQLGLDAKQLMTIPVDQQMTTVAAAIAKVENPALRSALSMDLLGKAGNRLVAAFKDEESIRKFQERLEKLGLAISQADLDNVNKLEGEVGKLKATWNAFLEKTVAAFAPYMVDLIKRINDAVDASGGFEEVLEKSLTIIEAMIKGVAILAAVYLGGKAVQAATSFGSALADAVEYLPGGKLASKIFKGVGAAIGFGAAAGVAVVTNDVISTVDSEMERLRNSIRESRGERSKPAPKPVTPTAADLEKELAKAVGNSTDAYLEQYNAQTQIIGANRIEIEQRKIAEAIAKESKLSLEDVVRLEGEKIKKAAEGRITKELEFAITKDIQTLELERLGLSIQDKDQREIALAIRRKELEFGRALNEIEANRLRNEISLTQEKRKQVELDKIINTYTGTQPREVTQMVQAGAQIMGAGNPEAEANKTKMRAMEDLEAFQNEMRARGIANEEDYARARQKIEYDHQQKIGELRMSAFEQQLKASGVVNTEIINVAKTTMAQAQMVTQGGVVGIQGALGMLGGFLEQAGKNNKKAFEAQKAVAIAQTIISTYQAATQAFAAMSLIPVVGPALGFAAAATIVAAGLANVAAIRAQQYQGRQLGGPVMGGQSYIVGEAGPELFTPNTTGSITRNGDLSGGSPVNVTFTINAIDTSDFDTLITQRQGTIKQIISDAMLERGQRSMV